MKTPFDDLNVILGAGKLAAKSFRQDEHLAADHREKLARDTWAEAVKSARTAADGLLRKALKRRQDADKRLQDAQQAWEDDTDFTRLTAAYDRVRTVIAHAAEPEDVLRFVKKFPQDRYIQQALAEVGPTAAQRRSAQGDVMWQRGAISPYRLGREAAQRLAELEPETLKAARAEVEASHSERREVLSALRRCERLYDAGLWVGLGDKPAKFDNGRGGIVITTVNEYEHLYQEERAGLSASTSGELEG